MTSSIKFLCFITLLYKVSAECPQGWFDCENGRCIAMFWRCDGQNDCGNHRDEEQCDNQEEECPQTKFSCTDRSYCIPLSWQCDGEADCHDASDERSCAEGHCAGFTCSSNECLPSKWQCDGVSDCSDGSDEINCNISVADISCNIEDGHFPCVNGSKCLPPQQVCDGVHNCMDGADEGDFCKIKECNKTCDHSCYITSSGTQCYCKVGFSLANDEKTCLDIDECAEDPDKCSQRCHNSPGSYHCSCIHGYSLEDDHFCKADDPEPLLIFSDSTDLRGLWLRSNRYFDIHPAVKQGVGVDFDSVEKRVYWADIDVKNSATTGIYSSLLDGSDFKAVVTSGLNMPEDVALDWIARNLYITDSGLKQIVVCKVDGTVCASLITKQIDAPRAIVVDPPQGLMYWTDWGQQPAVMRGSMDGSMAHALITDDLKWPNGLTLDHTKNRLYWCDAMNAGIEYLEIKSGRRKVVVQDAVFHPFALTVFEDALYWSDWSTYSLESSNKFDGKDRHYLLRENGKHIMGLHIYHPVLRNIKGFDDPCWASRCSHLCVIGIHDSQCLCPAGYHLDKDQLTCIMDTSSKVLVLAEENVMYQIHQAAIGQSSIRKLPLNQLVLVGALTYDWVTKTVYASENTKEIIFALNMDNLNSKVILSSHIGSILGMDFDYMNRNLYWVDADKGSLEACHHNGSNHVVLRTNLGRPVDVAVNPPAGFLFIATVQDQRITRYDLDGNNPKILRSAYVALPLSLAVCPWSQILIWGDAAEGTIAAIDLMDETYSKPVMLQQYLGHITSITCSPDKVYWVTREEQYVRYFDLKNATQGAKLMETPSTKNGPLARKIVYAGPIQADISVCIKNHGNCSHFCTVTSTGVSCLCPPGMKLNSDKRTCSQEEGECRIGERMCRDKTCISTLWWCDGYEDCDDKSDETNCHEQECIQGFQCDNGHCLLPSWRCDGTDDCGDGSDERNCSFASCRNDQFTCSNGQCIPLFWKCDLESDCENSEDEKDCSDFKCPEDHMQCKNGQCVHKSWICDGEPDCIDAADEINCDHRSNCQPTDYNCYNGNCIDHKLVCDHTNDCEDGSDEIDCDYSSLTCPPNMVSCDDGQCIYNRDVCDSYFDCHLGEDEYNCTAKSCDPWEFFCTGTLQCISRNWLCDGEDDCGDNMDEMLVYCHNKTSTTTEEITPCWSDEFRCGSQECITWDKVCDGSSDCLDLSDEGDHCDAGCQSDNGGCAQRCRETPSGPKCGCDKGYRLLEDGKACEDTDECEEPGHCSHYCFNTKGSFKCSCEFGYSLAADRKTCKVEGEEAVLLYLLPNQIRSLSIAGHSEHILAQEQTSDMKGMDYDQKTGAIFWTDTKAGIINMIVRGTKTEHTILDQIYQPSTIAFDWITANLYFTDGWGHIQSCDKDGKQCTDVLESGYPLLNGLVLYPNEGIMFFCAWHSVLKQENGVIERANMDGSDRIVIVSKKVLSPSSPTIDYILKKLYWSDVSKNIIEMVSFDGSNRTTVVKSGIVHPFSITLFEDWLYWTDYRTDSIMACNKFTGTTKTLIHHGDVKASVLTVAHEVHQPSGINPCALEPCDHICLLRPFGYSCACGHGYTLANDSTSCNYEDPEVHEIEATPMCDPPCENGGRCKLRKKSYLCICPSHLHGKACEYRMESHSYTSTHVDLTWVVALVIAGAVICLFVVLVFYIRRYRHKLHMDMVVGYKNPAFGFNTESLLGHEQPPNEDDLAYTKEPGFQNPMFNEESRTMLLPQDGEFQRWSSNESVDSAFISENQKDTAVTVEEPSGKSKKLVYFFKKQ